MTRRSRSSAVSSTGWTSSPRSGSWIRAEWQGALSRIAPGLRQALGRAVDRVREYHEHQREPGFHLSAPDGSVVGMKVTPLDRVGLYVPGGKASYPSSVVMNAVPAMVAGVQEIVAVVPPSGVTDTVLAACALSGVTRIFRIGGAQAVGALAFGTATVPRVDKIVGPGNRWVAEAKRQVVGQVGIDMVAGPTEVLIIADAHREPGAGGRGSHRPGRARRGRLQLVRHARRPRWPTRCPRHWTTRSRAPRAAGSRGRRSSGTVWWSWCPRCGRRSRWPTGAPPSTSRSWPTAPSGSPASVRHAGAIFLGDETPEPVGDYLAGPSHVLPTAGTARYASPLGVYDFVKRTSVIRYSAARLAADADAIVALAEAEGLHGHAEAVRIRVGRSLRLWPMPPLPHRARPPGPAPRWGVSGPCWRSPGLFMVVEAVGGWIAGSFALLADAGHMLTDVGALGLSLLTAWIAQRPADHSKTYGYLRWEILAALVNGAALFGIAGWVVVEAVQRIQHPEPVRAGLFLGRRRRRAGRQPGEPGGCCTARGRAASTPAAPTSTSWATRSARSARSPPAAIIALTGWTVADPLVSDRSSRSSSSPAPGG